jgi:alpha-beta hydrolase superfamily lysophospholipase
MEIIFGAAPPPGAESLAATWIRIAIEKIGILPAAVAQPSGVGPFPTVLLLHGSHGFAHEYVRLALDLAANGFLSVAVGWFREGSGAGLRFVTPISCADAPPRPDPLSPEVFHLVGCLVGAARSLPQARSDRLALFGHSRGGGAVLNYVLRRRNVQAAVLSSARYPTALLHLCPELDTPLLMLHGTNDRPDDGGTEFTNVEMARTFERALRSAAKRVDAVYYPGGRHNDIFAQESRYQNELSRMDSFLTQHLAK